MVLSYIYNQLVELSKIKNTVQENEICYQLKWINIKIIHCYY